jgi:hypothetical protein
MKIVKIQINSNIIKLDKKYINREKEKVNFPFNLHFNGVFHISIFSRKIIYMK